MASFGVDTAEEVDTQPASTVNKKRSAMIFLLFIILIADYSSGKNMDQERIFLMIAKLIISSAEWAGKNRRFPTIFAVFTTNDKSDNNKIR